jgi:5-methylcytosine-specific restriction endonuclease McrA
MTLVELYAPVFKKRTSSMIGKMRARCTEKRDKRGRVLRVGREIPFSLLDLRVWLLARAEAGGNVWLCEYCGKGMVIEEVELDHKVPLSRGGSPDLENLTPSDKLCNKTKGELTSEEYRALREGLQTFPPAAEAYILKALRTAGIGFEFHRRGKGKVAA